MPNLLRPAWPEPGGRGLIDARLPNEPGGLVARVRRGRVAITAVDPASGTICFVGPNQVVRTVAPTNPDLLRLNRSLKVADQVDIRL